MAANSVSSACKGESGQIKCAHASMVLVSRRATGVAAAANSVSIACKGVIGRMQMQCMQEWTITVTSLKSLSCGKR